MTTTKNNPFTPRQWKLGAARQLELGPVSRLMGILNVTPDSFSDGGRFVDLQKAIEHAARMIDEGADIIDVGGQSTRPNADALSEQEEQERILPVIEALAERNDCLISIDTYRSNTAKLALAAGAHIVNDVWGLQYDGQMAPMIAKAQCGVCIMHNSRKRDTSKDLIEDQIKFLSHSLSIGQKAGIDTSQIVVDPGFGFGKNADENLQLLNRFAELDTFGLPILAGTSRKRFTGAILGEDDNEHNRDIVTCATSVIARMAGCQVFRVHDVKTNKLALMLADGVINSCQV